MTLVLLHTTPVTLAPFKELAQQHLPGVRIINMLDDSLLNDVIAAGHVTPEVEKRLQAYADQAVTAGADAAMSCCSSVGEAFTKLTSSIPLWRIDQAMAEQAAQYDRIGVLATVKTTLDPTVSLIRSVGGKEIEAVVVPGAFEALRDGRAEEHDRLVLTSLNTLLQRSDVVVLAQASMARLLPRVKSSVPILTSPVSGLQSAYARMKA
jgi:Asp/Glu/hydantoin racemase